MVRDRRKGTSELVPSLYVIQILDDVFAVGSMAAMGKLHPFGNVRIVIYANDHLPAHFHILTPDAEALVEIASRRILKGSVPAKVESGHDVGRRQHRHAQGGMDPRQCPFPRRLRRAP